jgi:hypothetical protein
MLPVYFPRSRTASGMAKRHLADGIHTQPDQAGAPRAQGSGRALAAAAVKVALQQVGTGGATNSGTLCLHPGTQVTTDDALHAFASGIDVCLHLVRADHGSAVANQVARQCVVPPWREGSQAQYIVQPMPPEGANGTARPAPGPWNTSTGHSPCASSPRMPGWAHAPSPAASRWKPAPAPAAG